MFYIYLCKECRFEKDISHGMTEEPTIRCDCCFEIMKRKITGGSGIHYKGQGWSSKNNATASKPKHYKEVGIKVDHDLKKEMQNAGEI